MKDAEWVATLAVHSIKPRKWKDHEIELIKETAERTWAAVEWARAEAALRASEERLRSLFDTMGEGVAIMQLVRNDAGDVVDTQYLELNLSFERLTGFGRDVVAGRKTSEVFPLHFAAMQPRLATVKGTAGPERFECFIAETGRWLSCYAAPFGGPDGFAVFFDDVTERKRAEEAVRASEERLRQALCSSQRFHALSARLLAGADTAEVFAEVLEMAVATMEADCASLQIFEPGDGNGQGPALRLVANRGFHPDSALIWERVDVSDTSVCSRVLSTSERAVIEDVEVSNGVADGDQRAYRLSGIRGVQTTPLISRTGRLLGAISTQWRRPHRASERQFASFDVLARQVADLIERAQVDEALRRANEKLEQRVAERTAELAGANDRLREEVRERQRAEAARSELLRKLVSAQEDERRRVARDLHDSVGQFLAGLSLAFKAVEASNGELPPATVAKLHEAKNMADALGKEVHGLAVRLRPTALDDLGLPAALGQLTAEWSTRTGVSADFQTTGLDNGRLPPDIETVLYRVVQEALTNVGKHAQATAVSIVMGRHDGTVTAVVEDNGVGFDAETAGRGRLGLVGMRERVTLAGGELDLESAPGAGATVIARVPVRRES
jgi:PAS domain S-box-containing protein